ncbi:peptidoglycan hydrolase CwlO-like protein [Geomicrobium halophilum]|uniref:Peptidoglycan hydrolase CwlO-like protein n=1 Tax=Geomicrobium halophilum TaxID=549000 RepID=A0A841Q025_9BACL|nr:M23 family metallopeptidase [Geomicrobium halophilum]MBB6450355.1 peptidoglycan hydrolase CwlO-like protein [Geomicrobium halophilum]
MQVKKQLLLGAAFMLGLSSWAVMIGQAEANGDLEEELEEIRKSQENIEDDIETKEEDLKAVEEAQAEIKEEIEALDKEMTETVTAIEEKEAEVDAVEEELEQLDEEISQIEERIEKRDKLLKERATTMYKSGGGTVEYIEVLLGAQSFGDFIDRVRALSTIAEQDQEILDEHIADHELLEEKKTAVEDNLVTLESHVDELETLSSNLEAQMKEKETVMAGLDEDEHQLLDELEEIEDEEEILRQQELAKKNEIERAEKAEQANSKAEDETSSNREESSSSSPVETASASEAESSDGDESGSLARPATGEFTSQYGMRNGSMHHGVDIGQGGRSNVPIVAAESGEVSYAGYMGGYGKTVIITHQVDGQTLTTLYAHLATSSVSVGDQVSRSEQIGIMGNTGRSTGPHLHFEVHEGDWNSSKSHSVDPMNYIH